jgi:hypothetical protein
MSQQATARAKLPGGEGTAAPASRWMRILLAAAIVVLGLSVGLIPLFQGRLFLFNDNGDEYYPHTQFLTQALRSWTIPQWWPNVGDGTPVVAEGEAHYSPIRLMLAAALPAPASFMSEIALYFALTGLGTYLFLRAIRLHPLAASAGALGFMFGSHFTIELRDMGLLRAACLFPWLMWLAEISFHPGKIRRALWLAPPAVALQYLAGNPVYSVITLVAVFCYLLFRAANMWDKLRLVLLWGAMTGLGLGMGAVQVIPMMRHVSESVRAGGLSLDYATRYNYSKLADFPHALFPYAYDLHNPVVSISGFYDGALIAVAAIFGFWWIRQAGAPVWSLAAGGAFAALMALGSATPLYGILWHLPLFNGFRFPNRYQFWTSFCFTCLGAVGLNRALEWNREHAPGGRFRPFLPLGLLIPALAAMLWIARPAMHEEIIYCVLLLAFSLGILYLLCVVRKPLVLLAAVNLLLLADLSYFRSYGGYAPSEKIEDGSRKDGLAGYLAQDPGRFRVLTLFLTQDYKASEFREQNMLVGSSPPRWGLDGVRYHGSLDLRRFEPLIESLVASLREQPDRAPEFSGFLDFLGAKYVVAPDRYPFPGWDKLKEEGGMTAWRIPQFHGGGFLVGSVAPEPMVADESIVDEIRSHPFDYQRTALIGPADLAGMRGLESGAGGVQGEVEPLPAKYDAMGFHVVSSRPALLVIPNNYYPGWTATVNGRPARIYRTDWVGMGVLVGAGESTVNMEFTTPGFHTGIVVSLVALVLWLGTAARWGKL